MTFSQLHAMDPLSIIQDEVSLEGLDGITIPSLWIRLENRCPSFPLKLDTYTKEFIWKSLVSSSNFTFYELPKERDDVLLTDRYADIDPETGIQTGETFSPVKNEIYPVNIIMEDPDGIQGSCVFYKERKDVTKTIRNGDFTELLNLEEAFKRFGRKLHIVASQKLRFFSLVGPETDPDLKLPDHSYCILERLGRARWQGELQRDLHASSFKTEAGKLHYMRRALVQNGLITMQSHVARLPSGQQQHSILLLLKRFHVIRRSKYEILMETLSKNLQEMPDHVATLASLRAKLRVCDQTFKRVHQYMQAAKLAQMIHRPLEDLNPDGGPCTTKKGNRVLVRCLKLLKPYVRKEVIVEEEDDDNDEDVSGEKRKSLSIEGRVMERDLILQAYRIVFSAGTKGISQSALRTKMNIGKLEGRMICRRLEREGMMIGFLEDCGRQRTTKFISHRCVGASNHLQQFAKEQERNERLCSTSTPKSLKAASRNARASSSAPTTPSAPRAKVRRVEGPEVQNMDAHNRKEEENGNGQEREKTCPDRVEADMDVSKTKGKGKSNATKKKAGKCLSQSKQTTTPGEAKSSTNANSSSPEALVKEAAVPAILNPVSTTVPSDDALDIVENVVTVMEDNPKQKSSHGKSKKSKKEARPHETYRLLRRKNMIVEAVQNLKIIEGLYFLQKMINEEEKQDGISTKCCKKSILRLIRSLSREGMLKLYTTTVVQDGITKKVEMVVHPSIQPNDEIVKRAIDQVRFKISSSYSVARLQVAQEKPKEQEDECKGKAAVNSKDQHSKTEKKRAVCRPKDDFNPINVRGLSRKLGFQPKMRRLQIIHCFLWYLVYGHPHQQSINSWRKSSQFPAVTEAADSSAVEKPEPSNPSSSGGTKDPSGAVDQDESPLTLETSPSDDEDALMNASKLGHLNSELKVYMEEESWKRFLPPVPVHKEFGHGWSLVSDILLCLPLSIFIQITQINYEIDGLNEYLNDPIKQHYLIRVLPSKMKRQLLYKRKYIYAFHENMQKLVYMGLMQFAPFEKFQDKDQVFVYIRHHATIVDTTSAEPHYWQVTEVPDKPFDKRHYTFSTYEDVESYWFDLLCVCLNTPLGVIRNKRGDRDLEVAPFILPERCGFPLLADMLKGDREVTDDGTIPGDGRGAGGLDSEFFGHLKRNWLWTNHLLSVKKPDDEEVCNVKNRLKNLLSKNALRIALKADEITAPRCLTAKRPLITVESVECAVEPASRNREVVGGKKQKRRRNKKETVKISRRKKKEPKKRTPAHDEADHRALKRMTRQRVYWSAQEDSLLLLCTVAAHIINSQLPRPFVPYCVVRDMLHSEFEKSLDKTSLAVGRRTRYILKNPQTLLNYRVCLAEVYQDKALMKRLEQNRPTDPDKPEDCSASFLEYTKLLRHKFSSNMASCNITIPDTASQLFSRFKVYTIDNGNEATLKDSLTSTEDIHALVLNNLIQSTLVMSNSQMKTSRSFQTFHTYSQYDQEVLCKVFLECRRRGLVNRRRVSQASGPKKRRALPILPMSYQLSQTYYRTFSWRFPYELISDIFRFVRTLIGSGVGDEKPATTFYNETESRPEDWPLLPESGRNSKNASQQGNVGEKEGAQGCVKERNNKQSRTGSSNKDRKSGNGHIGEEGEETEQTIKAEANEGSQDTENSFTINANDGPSSGELSEGLSEGQQGRQPTTKSTAPKPSEDPQDGSDMWRFPHDSPGGACTACLSLMSLGLVSVHVSIPKQVVVVDSSLVDNEVVKSMAALEEEDDDDDEGEECEGRKRLEVKSHQASHTNYLMMRGYCVPGIVKQRNLNIADNIVVESCMLRFRLRNTPAHQVFSTEGSPPLDLSQSGPHLLPPLLTQTVRTASPPPSHSQRGYAAPDLEACAQLRSRLDQAGERGLAMCDLQQTHSHLLQPQSGRTRGLQQYLQELQEDGQVLQVGGLGVRWVLARHAAPWLLSLSPLARAPPHAPQDGLAPFWEQRHNIPFLRKRCRDVPGDAAVEKQQQEQEEEEEPPMKKKAGEGEGEGQSRAGLPPAPRGGAQTTLAAEERQGLQEEALAGQQEQEKEQLGLQEEALAGQQEQEQKQLGVQEEALAGQQEQEKEQLGVQGEALVGQQEQEKEQLGVQEKALAGEGEEGEMGEMGEMEGGADRTQNDGNRPCFPAAPEAPANVEEEASDRFVSRPWRLVDGSLNSTACKGMLEGLMYHIMSRPGLTLRSMLEHYRNVLQPVVVLDLIQVLIDLGCVRRRTVVASKPSLFSCSAPATLGDGGTATTTTDDVFYEPTVSCCLRLAQLFPNEPNWNQFVQ